MPVVPSDPAVMPGLSCRILMMSTSPSRAGSNLASFVLMVVTDISVLFIFSSNELAFITTSSIREDSGRSDTFIFIVPAGFTFLKEVS